MATLAEWKSGTLPTLAGTTPGNVTSDTGEGFPAQPSIKVASDNTTSVARFQYTATTQTAVRVYIKTPTAWGSQASNPIFIRETSSSTVARFGWGGTGAPGQCRLYGSGGAQVENSTTGTIAVDTWYRVELLVNHGTNQARCGVFPVGSDTAVWDSGWITSTFGASSYRVELGANVGGQSNETIWIDTILVTDDASGFVGRDVDDIGADPLPTPTSWLFQADPGPEVVRITGTWSPSVGADSYEVQVQRWNGTAWVAFGTFPAAASPVVLDAIDGLTECTTYRARVRALPAE